VEPLAPARFRIQFTASTDLRDKLERLQALMRSSVPDGDLATIIDVVVTRELERIESKRFGKTKTPRKSAETQTPREQPEKTPRKPLAQTPATARSRHIPAAVKRAVHHRDEGRCAYRDRHGRRCTKRHDLEFHHREPFGRGGDHRPENLALTCRAHNALLAEQDYGEGKMALFKRSASRPSVAVANDRVGGAPTAQTHPPG
jgi:5-methylcytosine-specific restriction endonuclease McrA